MDRRIDQLRRGGRQWGKALPFILPGFVLMALFILYPLLRNVWISFTEFNVIKNEVVRFVGVQNYVDAMKDRHYLTAFRNTLLYTLVTVPGQMFLGLVLASLINSVRRGQTAFKVICYLPVITSWVVVSLVFKYLFMSGSGGLVNYFLMKLHIISKPVAWLQGEWTANLVLWLFGIWKGVGWVMVIYLAALQGIPKERYEAAELDGAGLWRKFWHITVPSVRPTTFYVMVNMIIGSFNVFIQVMMLTGGNPNGKTSVLQYLLYDKAFNQFEFGEASAIGMISAVTIVALTIVLNRVFKLDNVEQEG